MEIEELKYSNLTINRITETRDIPIPGGGIYKKVVGVTHTYSTPNEYLNGVLKQDGEVILPSKYQNHGVVVHTSMSEPFGTIPISLFGYNAKFKICEEYYTIGYSSITDRLLFHLLRVSMRLTETAYHNIKLPLLKITLTTKNEHRFIPVIDINICGEESRILAAMYGKSIDSLISKCEDDVMRIYNEHFDGKTESEIIDNLKHYRQLITSVFETDRKTISNLKHYRQLITSVFGI